MARPRKPKEHAAVTTGLKVSPVEHEKTRFLVDSETREDIRHLVDMAYQEGREKPHPACSCEDHMTRGKVCKHIRAVQQHEATK